MIPTWLDNDKILFPALLTLRDLDRFDFASIAIEKSWLSAYAIARWGDLMERASREVNEGRRIAYFQHNWETEYRVRDIRNVDAWARAKVRFSFTPSAHLTRSMLTVLIFSLAGLAQHAGRGL